MLQETKNHIKEFHPEKKNISILSTTGSFNTKIYIKKEFNDFENSYPNQILQFEKRTHLEEIFYLIQQGKNGIARIKLKKYLFKDYKWTILYFILFNKNLTKIILRKLGYIY